MKLNLKKPLIEDLDSDYANSYATAIPNREIFNKIVALDATTNLNPPTRMGQVAKFLLDKYVAGETEFVDNPETKQAVDKFLELRKDRNTPAEAKALKNYQSVQAFIDYALRGIGFESSAETSVTSKIDTIYNKYYNTINKDVFTKLITIDPETNLDKGVIGNFAKNLLLRCYKKGETDIDSKLPLIKKCYDKFIKDKAMYSVEQQNLLTYDSVASFIELMSRQPEKSSLVKSLEQNETVDRRYNVKVKDSFKLLGSTDQYDIIQPLSKAANCAIARHPRWDRNTPGLHWCTGCSEMSQWTEYAEGGKNIYCLINRRDNMNKSINYQFYTINNNSKIGYVLDGYDEYLKRGDPGNLDPIFNKDPELAQVMITIPELQNLPEVKSYIQKLEFISGKVIEFTGAQEFAQYSDFSTLIKNIKVAEGITKIDDCQFMGFVGLESIELPDSILRIGVQAFKNCNSLKTIKLPKNLQSIGAEAFNSCTKLKGRIEIPNSVTKIGIRAFEHTGNVHLNILDSRTNKLRISNADLDWFSNPNNVKTIPASDSIYIGESLYSDLNEEILDEKIPKDLALAYRNSNFIGTNSGSHNQNMPHVNIKNRRKVNWDYETANYEVLTKDEAKQFLGIKSNNGRASRTSTKADFYSKLSQLRFIVNGGVVEFDSNLDSKDSLQAILEPNIGLTAQDFSAVGQTGFSTGLRFNGKAGNTMGYSDIVILIDVCDKIYKTDEYEHSIAQKLINGQSVLDRRATNSARDYISVADPKTTLSRNVDDKISALNNTKGAVYINTPDTGNHNKAELYAYYQRLPGNVGRDLIAALESKQQSLKDLLVLKGAIKQLKNSFKNNDIEESEYETELANLTNQEKILTADYNQVCAHVTRLNDQVVVFTSENSYSNYKRFKVTFRNVISARVNELREIADSLSKLNTKIDKIENTAIKDTPEYKAVKNSVQQIDSKIEQKQREIASQQAEIERQLEQLRSLISIIRRGRQEVKASQADLANLISQQNNTDTALENAIENLMVERNRQKDELINQFIELKKLIISNFGSNSVPTQHEMSDDVASLIDVVSDWNSTDIETSAQDVD